MTFANYHANYLNKISEMKFFLQKLKLNESE